ncbi:MAG: YqhA family protein [Campylobacterales bacterium]
MSTEHDINETLRNDAKESSWLERGFEAALWRSRLWVLFSVISSLLASLVLFIIGSLDILDVLSKTWGYYILNDHSYDLHTKAVGEIIGAIDLYLIAVVLLIFSFGIYELFVSQIDEAQSHSSSKILQIHSLDELKDKIAKVIIMVLIVKYFQMVLDMSFGGALEMLYLAASILGLSLALYFLHNGVKHE